MRERGCTDEIISAGSKVFGALAALDRLALFPLRYEGKRERVKGIEPSCAAWEAAVLPLNYTRGAISILDFRLPIATETNRERNGS
jgi:hypothetical protein